MEGHSAKNLWMCGGRRLFTRQQGFQRTQGSGRKKKKNQTEGRISSQDMQNRTGSRVHKKRGKNTWRFGQWIKMAVMRASVAPAGPGDNLRRYQRPEEAVQLTSTAFAGGTN